MDSGPSDLRVKSVLWPQGGGQWCPGGVLCLFPVCRPYSAGSHLELQMAPLLTFLLGGNGGRREHRDPVPSEPVLAAVRVR